MQEELMSQITDKKEFYESILGKKLTKVSGLLLTTAVNNGYSSVVGYGGGYYGGGGLAGNYDPETNMMEAITTLSITFDTGKAVAK
jgi:hypothetical protein